jgi:hypothetical protein
LHPIELIELMIAGGILLVILFISFMLKGKWRKILFGLAILYFLTVGVIYFIRPYWIDIQIEKKVDYLQVYLEDRYPGETWEYWIVPHREDGYEHMNPYHIGVIFDTEPEVEYQYFVRDKDTIKQSGYSTPSEFQSELLHIEEK